LNQNTVNGRVFVELRDFFDNRVLLHIHGIVVTERLNADIGAGADFISDIEARGRIAADDDDGQSWRRARFRNDTLHALEAFAPDLPGDRVAVDDFRSHVSPPF
jgi:hypothetical protein